MRFLIALCVVCVLSFVARADEPAKFYLNADGTVEKRVTAVEVETATLKKELADLKKQVAALSSTKASAKPGCECGPNCPCAAGAKSVKPGDTGTAPGLFAEWYGPSGLLPGQPNTEWLAPAGTLRTASGALIQPNGRGGYEYAPMPPGGERNADGTVNYGAAADRFYNPRPAPAYSLPQSSGGCPGGVCPAPSSSGFRR